MVYQASVVGVLGGTDEEIAEVILQLFNELTPVQCFAGINAGLRGGVLQPVVGPRFNYQFSHVKALIW